MKPGALLPELVQRSAEFSECGRYRHTLTMRLGPDVGTCVWIMANSSTADESSDDPSTRKVQQFTRQMGFGIAVVLNVCAFCTPHPTVLVEAWKNGVDVVGPDNLRHIEAVLARPEVLRVVYGWGDCLEGARPASITWRGRVQDLVKREGFLARCFGRTRAGNPSHPLWLVRSSKPVYFDAGDEKQLELIEQAQLDRRVQRRLA